MALPSRRFPFELPGRWSRQGLTRSEWGGDAVVMLEPEFWSEAEAATSMLK